MLLAMHRYFSLHTLVPFPPFDSLSLSLSLSRHTFPILLLFRALSHPPPSANEAPRNIYNRGYTFICVTRTYRTGQKTNALSNVLHIT